MSSSSSTPQPAPSFEDAALKAAVRRVWSRERAPSDVSQRIAGMIRQKPMRPGTVEETLAPVMAIRPATEPLAWQTNWAGLAAAAAILLALGTVVYVLGRGGTNPRPLAAAPLPADVVNALIATHDACCHLHDHHFMKDAPRGDYPAIAGQLASRLGHPVLAAPIGGEAWSFRGAAVCPVGSTPAAHLVFAHERPDEYISVFSLPESAAANSSIRPAMNWQCGDGPCYESTVAGHPVVGFTGNGAFYCLVGSSDRGSLTVDELRSICDRLRRDTTRVAAPSHVASDLRTEPVLELSSLHPAHE